MPTGYTAKTYENEPETLREFILHCATGMFYGGDLVRYRSVDGHYTRRIADAEDRIAELEAMTDNDKDIAASRAYAKRLQEYRQSEAENAALRKRYEDRIAEVRAWSCPEELASLKKFMLSQLTESLAHDCHEPGNPYYAEPARQSGEHWYGNEIQAAHRSLDYARQFHAEELARVQKHNAWVTTLFAYLPPLPEKEAAE